MHQRRLFRWQTALVTTMVLRQQTAAVANEAERILAIRTSEMMAQVEAQKAEADHKAAQAKAEEEAAAAKRQEELARGSLPM